MISFIVDGYDPWERVKSLLDHIHADMPVPCDVILISSLLLETAPEVCRRYGASLFGDNFRLVGNDDYSIYRARLRGQELARGNIFFYLSPLTEPAPGALACMARELEEDPGVAVTSSPLAFIFPGGTGARLLAHGFVTGKDRRLTPVLQGTPLGTAAAGATLSHIVPQPYCFCSRGPFYTPQDASANFWGCHLGACARRANGGNTVSLGKAVSFLHDEAFSVYIVALAHARPPEPLPAASPERLPLPVALTAYGRYRVGTPLPCPPQSSETAEEIFWGLFATQRPEYIASASRALPQRPLGDLARQTLLEIAGVTWEAARAAAEEYLAPPRPGWQTVADWLAAYAPLADTIYAQENPSFWQSLKKGKNPAMALVNLTGAVARGLWGRPRC